MSALPPSPSSLGDDLYRKIFEKTGLGIAQIDVKSGTFLEGNVRFAEMLGYDLDDLSGMPILEILPEVLHEYRDDLLARLRVSAEGHDSMELCALRRDGSTVWIKLILAPIGAEGEEPSTHLAVVEDITATRRANEEIDELNLAIEHAMQGISKLDAGGHFVMVKPHYARMLGYEPEELVGRSWEVTVPQDDHPAATQCYLDMIRNGRAEAECQALRKDGSIFYKQLLLVKILNAQGEHDGHYCFMRDITQRKHAEISMVKSRERLAKQLAEVELLYRTAPVGLCLLDTSLILLRVNEVLAAIENKSVDSVVGQSLEDGLPELADKLTPICEQVVKMGRPILNIDVDRSRGAGDEPVSSYLVSLYPLKDGDGDVLGVSTVVQDITEKKQAEHELRLRHEQVREMDAQLTHVSRLSTMGEMVAGIAHEINQPLSAIANFALASKNTLEASESCDDDNDISNWLTEINRQAVRCGDIIRRLRNFVQKCDGDREPLDLGQVVRDSIALIDNGSCESSPAIRYDLPGVIPQVSGNPVELQQVFVNLLKNACEATQEISSPRIVISIASESQTVQIVVEDNGSGIVDETRQEIFEPFFTTKDKGMGMGLAISRSIIDSHHGTLRYDADFRGGARFVVQLPVISIRGDQPDHESI